MTSVLSPKKSNVCAAVITHNPDGGVGERIATIRDQVQEVLIVDNNSEHGALNLLTALSLEPRNRLIRNEQNLGIASALNQAVRWAAEHGFMWVLTLDQDTVVTDDMIATLTAAYEAFPEKEKLAIIGSNYRDSKSGKLLIPSDPDDQRPWQELKTAITSGSLVSLAAYSVIGPFREQFFMDCVDLEYCLRARAHGFKVIVTKKPLMDHSIGATTMHWLPWKRTGTSNHVPLRRYYMTRNLITLIREYSFQEPAWAVTVAYSHLKSIALFCLFEQTRILKLKYTGFGLFDGIVGNYSRRLG